MIGTVMAQTPAASNTPATGSTDTTTKPNKVKKHKKHSAAKSTNNAQTPAANTAAPAK